jgi:hypothetical protein
MAGLAAARAKMVMLLAAVAAALKRQMAAMGPLAASLSHTRRE